MVPWEYLLQVSLKTRVQYFMSPMFYNIFKELSLSIINFMTKQKEYKIVLESSYLS